MADKKTETQETTRQKPVRMVQKFCDEAIQNAGKLAHDDYKNIKHMNKYQLCAFMMQISSRGFKAGYDAARKELEESAKKAELAEQATDIGGDAVEND